MKSKVTVGFMLVSLFLLGGTSAWAAVPEAKKVDLSGLWNSGEDIVRISQSGQSVTATWAQMSEAAQRESGWKPGGDLSFRGTLEGNRLRGELHYRFSKKSWKQCPAHREGWTEVVLTLSPDGDTLQGHWLDQILYSDCTVRRGEGKPWTITRQVRKEYQVAKVVIDYRPWSWHRDKLLRELEKAGQERHNAFKKVESAGKGDLRSAFEKVGSARVELENSVRERAQALRTSVAPEAEGKNRRQRDYESYNRMRGSLRELQKRLEQISAQLALTPTGESERIMQLNEEQKLVEGQISRLQQEMRRYQDFLGLTKKMKEAEKRAAELERVIRDKEKAYRQTLTDLRLAESRFDAQYKIFSEADEKLLKAIEKWEEHEKAGSPIIAAVWVLSEGSKFYYKGEYWRPDEELKKIQEALPKMRAHIKRAEGQQKEAYKVFLDKSSAAVRAGDNLVSQIWVSATAQLGAEAADILYGAVTSTEELGQSVPSGSLVAKLIGERGAKLLGGFLAGLLVEVSQKAAKVWIMGDELIQNPDYNRENLMKEYTHWMDTYGLLDLGTAPVKKIVKTVGTHSWIDMAVERRREIAETVGTGAKAALAGFLLRREAGILQSQLARLPKGAPIPDEFFFKVGTLEALDDSYQQALKRLQGGGFKKVYGDWKVKLKESLLSKKFIGNLAKDVAVHEFKAYVANLTEGEALRQLVEAEMEAKAAALLNHLALLRYNEALDEYEKLLARQQRIVEQYEPEAHLKVLQKSAFSRGSKLEIRLANEAAERRQMEVVLGEKPARLMRQTAAIARDKAMSASSFSVTAEGLKEDGQGGVVLKIEVKR